MQKIDFVNDKQQDVFASILSQKPNLNYQILNSLLRKKDIRVNGKKISKNQIVQKGDTITLFLPDKQQKTLDIIYQDEQILVVFKPQGLETTKADKTFLQTDCVEDLFEGCFACHRLDKNTEGLVVLAKNTEARDLMFDCFKNHKIQKFYKAIAFGSIQQDQTFVDYHKKQNNKVFIFSEPQKDASKIITSYVLEKTLQNNQQNNQSNYQNLQQSQTAQIKDFLQNPNLSLLDINIKTGKTHQIRAQLAHHKIYILGDERYGQKDINKLYQTKKQQLCAYKIVFEDMPEQLAHLNKKTISATPTFLKKYGF